MKTYVYEKHPYFKIPEILVVVRHGQSEGNILSDDEVAKHDKPSHDFALSGTGVIQALAVGQVLRREFPDIHRFNAIVHSTYRRTKETYERAIEIAIGEGSHKSVFPVVPDSRVNEKDEGIRHKLTEEDINKNFPLALKLFEKFEKYHHVPIHGESVPQVEMRIRDIMRDLVQHDRKSVLIFGHGVWMRILHHMISMGDIDKYEGRGEDGLPHPKNGVIYYFVTLSNCIQLNILDEHINE